MTPEAQRIAIAEACPDKFFIHHGRIYLKTGPNTIAPEVDPLSDLNACHEMEKVLNGDQMCAYVWKISRAMDQDNWLTRSVANVAHATAAQRAEAFLRCIGKWVE